MEPWRSESSSHDESCRELSPRGSGDSAAPSHDESYERPPSRTGWYSPSDYREYDDHRSEPRASYSLYYAYDDAGPRSTSRSSTPERQTQKDSKGETTDWYKNVRSLNNSPRQRTRPRYKRIASGWAEVFSTISEEPTMEEEYAESYRHDCSCLSTGLGSLKTSTLTSKSLSDCRKEYKQEWSLLSTRASSLRTSTLTSTYFGEAVSVSAAMETGNSVLAVVPTCSQGTATNSEVAEFAQSLRDSSSMSYNFMARTQKNAAEGSTEIKAEGLQKLQPTATVVLRHRQDAKGTSPEHPEAPFLGRKIIGCEPMSETNSRSRLKLVAILMVVLFMMGILLIVRSGYQLSLRPDRGAENDKVAEKAFSAETKITFTDSKQQGSTHPKTKRRVTAKMHAPRVNQRTLHTDKAHRMGQTNASNSTTRNVTRNVTRSHNYDVTVRNTPGFPTASVNHSTEFIDNDTDLVRAVF